MIAAECLLCCVFTAASCFLQPRMLRGRELLQGLSGQYLCRSGSVESWACEGWQQHTQVAQCSSHSSCPDPPTPRSPSPPHFLQGVLGGSLYMDGVCAWRGGESLPHSNCSRLYDWPSYIWGKL